MNTTKRGIGNGYLPLPLMGSKFLVVYGGPYNSKPANMRGVKMAAENPRPADVIVPTEDFGVPTREALLNGLDKAVDFLRRRESLYVGCGAGIGRTGLFLALLAKLFGVQRPIGYVRDTYLAHAVETTAQERLIDGFKFPFWLRLKVAMVRAMGLFPSKNPVLNNEL